MTDLALEQAKQGNEEMKRRLEELENKLKQGIPGNFTQRFASALMLCLLTLLLTLSLTNYAYSSTQNEIVFKYVPQGFSAPATGYWADEPTGRNMLHMIQTYREQS